MNASSSSFDPGGTGTESVLLIGLAPEEVELIQDLVSDFDLETELKTIPSIEDASEQLQKKDVLLVILRADGDRKRHDQDIRRIKRRLLRSVPLLVLVPPELSGKVREYLRAGAEEYWILPLDSTTFPPRLYVLLEWGQSALSEEGAQIEKSIVQKLTSVSFVQRVFSSLGHIFSFEGLEKTIASESGRVAGKWKMIRRLGFGSFGEAWLVQEREGESLAVAKIPHTHKLNTKCIREAAILKRMTGHPNAVELLEVVKEEGKVILIQEFVEGDTLQQFLDQGMDGTTKETAFRQLVEVVAYAHEKRIMHRDIKPENIIINRHGALKLLDFGTGKDLSRRSISNTVIGSRPFMAPEQIMGKSRLASDVWALGVILYALSTGFLPFYDDNEKQLMDIILEANPENPRNLEPEMPEELEKIILKCLQKDWNQRYRDATELRNDMLKRLPYFGEGRILTSDR